MTKISEVRDLTEPTDDSWKVIYEVTRNDGARVTVDCSAHDTARAVILDSGDDEARAFLRDGGAAAAVEYAEHAEPRRGTTKTTIFPDTHSGSLHVSHDYELASADPDA
jgi:hypothetical protein